MDKMKFTDFVCQVAKKSGYSQLVVRNILNAGCECAAYNLSDGLATTVMQGVILYPAVFPARDRKDSDGNIIHDEEIIYPRARFGQGFKKKMLFS